MKYLASTSREIHFTTSPEDDHKDELVPLLELILTYADGNEMQNVEGQMIRKQKYSECGVIIPHSEINEVIEYLQQCQTDMEERKEQVAKCQKLKRINHE
jgi:hypothetical protein